MTTQSAALPAPRRALAAWLLYDVASSTYAAVVPTVLFALYFTSEVAGSRADAQGQWGLTTAVALLVAGLLAPLVGAWADAGRRHAKLLAVFTLLCCGASALFALPGRGQVVLATVLYVAAQAGYTSATTIYDAYLKRLAPLAGGEERLSTRGWALGFTGGILLLLILMALPHDANGAPTAAYAFPVAALLFATIAAPAIAGLRDVVPVTGDPGIHAHPWRRVAHTLAHWREYRPVMRFLAGAYLVNDAMVTVGTFAAIYLRDHFGMRMADVLWLTLVYHLIALPATWLFGSLAARTTTRAAMAASIVIWIVAIVLMAFGGGRTVALALVALLAIVFGSTQALLRAMYSRIVPAAQAAEFFGFNAFAARLSAALGPLTMAALSALSGGSRHAILSLVAFLVAGAWLILRAPPTAPGDAGSR